MEGYPGLVYTLCDRLLSPSVVCSDVNGSRFDSTGNGAYVRYGRTRLTD